MYVVVGSNHLQKKCLVYFYLLMLNALETRLLINESEMNGENVVCKLSLIKYKKYYFSFKGSTFEIMIWDVNMPKCQLADDQIHLQAF